MFEIKPWKSLKGNSFTGCHSNFNRDAGRNISYKGYEIKNTNDPWLRSKYGSFLKFGIESTDGQVIPDKELCLSPRILYYYTCLWNGVQQKTTSPRGAFCCTPLQKCVLVLSFFWSGAHVPPISANEIAAFNLEKG